MKIHIIFVSVACVSMVCVTTPVEASPKEARHTSIETRASGMASSFPCPVSDSYIEHKGSALDALKELETVAVLVLKIDYVKYLIIYGSELQGLEEYHDWMPPMAKAALRCPRIDPKCIPPSTDATDGVSGELTSVVVSWERIFCCFLFSSFSI